MAAKSAGQAVYEVMTMGVIAPGWELLPIQTRSKWEDAATAARQFGKCEHGYDYREECPDCSLEIPMNEKDDGSG